MADQMLLTDHEEKTNDLEVQDQMIIDNLRLAVPHRLEKHWRLYGSSGKIPPGEKDKINAGKFNPKYAPCIYPVKIDPNEPWDKLVNKKYVNLKRCEHMLPSTYKEDGRTVKIEGKEATAYAENHCEEHVDWYLETHSRENGRPPATTQIKVPQWVDSEDEDPYITDRERRVQKVKSRMKEKEVTQEEIAEAVNEEITQRKRGRPRREET